MVECYPTEAGNSVALPHTAAYRLLSLLSSCPGEAATAAPEARLEMSEVQDTNPSRSPNFKSLVTIPLAGAPFWLTANPWEVPLTSSESHTACLQGPFWGHLCTLGRFSCA